MQRPSPRPAALSGDPEGLSRDAVVASLTDAAACRIVTPAGTFGAD
jgi:hypothetical protein